jgi:hypothetical protein
MSPRAIAIAAFSFAVAPCVAHALNQRQMPTPPITHYNWDPTGGYAQTEIDRQNTQFQMERAYLTRTVTEQARATPAESENTYRPLRGAGKPLAGGPPKIWRPKAITYQPPRFRITTRVGGIVARITTRGMAGSATFSNIFRSPGSFNFGGLQNSNAPTFHFSAPH